MKVLFDHQAFSVQTFGGISRYYSELVDGINKTKDNQAYIPILFSNNIHLQESNFKVSSFFAERNIRGKSKFIYKTNQLLSVATLQQKSYDIFHATYYNPYFIPHLKKHPLVVTFLDMIHEKFSSQFPELADNGLTTKHKQTLADRADRIIAISESTKRDIIDLLNVNPAKIEVIYLGSSLEPLIEKLTPEPYLLFVGRRERYKNFKGLLYAIHPLLKKYKLRLLCAGGGPFTNEERQLIHSVHADKIVEYWAISNDKTLSNLYQSAIGFVFPSLYEGFGIPILEAFACNCPCVLSNSSSLPEIAGDAALYFDPTDEESIAYAVEQLITDDQLRMKLINKGKKQLSKFSWTSTVHETIKVYEKCL